MKRKSRNTKRTPQFSQKQLSDAFDLVKDKSNWKMPINKVIEADDKTQRRIVEAVQHFCGSMCEIYPTKKSGHVRVVAAGYYACVGA